MSNAAIAVVAGIMGMLAGSFGLFLIINHLEKKRASLSTKRQQLQQVYSRLEILIRINGQEFDHYFKTDATNDDREFIEKTVWHPNYLEIKKIILENSHLLEEIPDELLQLLNYINIWLSDYELVYIKNLKDPPVFVRTNGYSYPGESDEFIRSMAGNLRKQLNK